MVEEEKVSLLRVSLGDLVQLSGVDQLCAELEEIVTLEEGKEGGREGGREGGE